MRFKERLNTVEFTLNLKQKIRRSDGFSFILFKKFLR